MQKRVNIAGTKLLSLGRSACKTGPRLAPENLDLERVFTTPGEGLTVPEWCANNIVCAELLEFRYVLGGGDTHG